MEMYIKLAVQNIEEYYYKKSKKIKLCTISNV